MDIFTQFLNIVDTLDISILDLACCIYIFKQVSKLIICIFKKIKGEKKK